MYDNSDDFFMSDEELMVLLKSNPEIASKLSEMTKTKAKRLFVGEKHKQKIFQRHSANKYLDGKWATHVYIDSSRKLVEKPTEDELYDYLYDFYKKQEERPKTYDEAFEAFIEDKRSRGISESTVKEYRRYHGFLSQEIREKELFYISEEELRKWLVNKYLPKKPKKEALKKMIQQLKAVFAYSIRKKLCFDNPAQDILLEDYAKFCDLTTRSNEERSFSDEEIEKLRTYCIENKTNPHAVVMLVAMETGMRAGELTALRKDDIRDGFIIVHRQQTRVPKTDANRKIYFTEVEYTKNERTNPRGGRPIPITQRCQEALDAAFDLEGDSEFLFHHPNGDPVIKDSYEQYLRRVCARLGIAITNNHAFRVAFNAKLIKAGVGGNERCLILGHSMQTNERHYSFSDKRQAETVRDKLNGLKEAL